jgi:hypothetical protein
VRAGHALVAQLNSLVAEGSSIAFAFGTPTDPGPARRQLSMLADADGDWQLRRRFDHTEVDEEEVIVGSLGALIAQALSEPEFRWSAVEQAMGLASPAGAFRAEVAEALRFCMLLQMSGPTKRFSELRKDWAGIAARADAAAAAVRDLRAALVQLPGWTNDVARQLLEPVEMPLFAWAFIARRQTNLIPKGPGGRPPMRVFFCLVFLLAAAFESATGRKAAVTSERRLLRRTLLGVGGGGVIPAVEYPPRGRISGARRAEFVGGARQVHRSFPPQGQNPRGRTLGFVRFNHTAVAASIAASLIAGSRADVRCSGRETPAHAGGRRISRAGREHSRKDAM